MCNFTPSPFPLLDLLKCSDVKRGKTLRPRARPELRGRGQFLEADAKAEAKNNCEKVPNND